MRVWFKTRMFHVEHRSFARFPPAAFDTAAPLRYGAAVGSRAGRTGVGTIVMPIENWSDDIFLVNLQDDPQFTDDMNALTDLIGRRGNGHVLLDFSEVHFLNSSNIARMLKLRKILASVHPGRLLLCGIKTGVWGVFLVTGLDKIFEFADNVPMGLAMLQMSSDPPAPGDSQRKKPS